MRLLAAAGGALASVAARSYIAGSTLDRALEARSRLSGQGLSSSLGYWNADQEGPQRVASACLEALDALASPAQALSADVSLSLKAPALGFDTELLHRIHQRAREARVRLHFDSLGPEWAGATFLCIARALRRGFATGCTLPARWARSPGDAEASLQLGIPVRLVKGQWEDPRFRGDVEGAFLRLVARLAGRAVHVGVATHDLPLAREALRRLKARGTACELQLLYGLPMRRLLHMAAAMDVGVRVYVPYGSGWLPYALSRIRQKPRTLLWLARDVVRGLAPHQRW